MRARIEDNILYLHQEDVPVYKKNGSIVRNNYFWSLRSIAAYSKQNTDWEFDREVWIALARMLLFFTQSGYLPLSATMLEFSIEVEIPDVFRSVSTRI